jgi:serine/threonine-protein kinase
MSAIDSYLCPSCGRGFHDGELYCPYDRSALSPTPSAPLDPLHGTEIAGAYTIIERLGEGGMGVVYRAMQNRLNRPIALKLITPQRRSQPRERERFRLEADAASRLSNPHAVTILDAGTCADGTPYIAMELLQGESLRARIDRGPLSVHAALTIASHVCDALDAAHSLEPQLVHRDIKPENVFVRDTATGPFATLLDFGLARFRGDERLTSENVVLGTPKYLAPELYDPGREADVSSDLYAAGALLFEMITRQAPFASGDPQALVLRHRHDLAPFLKSLRPDGSIPDALEQLVADLLAKDPDQRPPSARAVLGRLRDIEEMLPRGPRPEDAPTVESSASRGGRGLATAKPRKGRVGALALLTVALVVGGSILAFGSRRVTTAEASPMRAAAPVPSPKPIAVATQETPRPAPAPSDPAAREPTRPTVSEFTKPAPSRPGRPPTERRKPSSADLKKLDLN